MAASNRTIGITTSDTIHPVIRHSLKMSIYLAGGSSTQLTPSHYLEFESCTAYVISGGSDINPKLYGQTNQFSVNIDSQRDAMEMKIIEHALQYGKPLLGICRGAQLINVALGGTLYQNLSDNFEGFTHNIGLFKRLTKRKRINISPDSRLFSIINTNSISVNSIHHQGIHQLGENLVATSLDDFGIIQSIESIDKQQFLIGLQWHPELMLYSGIHRSVFKAFVKSDF